MGHIRGVISRHRATAQRGADPHPLRDVQAFLLVKFRDRGPLDLSGAGGVDTSWAQVNEVLGGVRHAGAWASRTPAAEVAVVLSWCVRGCRSRAMGDRRQCTTPRGAAARRAPPPTTRPARQVFYSLRAGSTEAALAAAERTSAPHMARKAADAQRGLRQLLEAWLADRAAFQREHGGQLLQDCERLLQAHGARQVRARGVRRA
jgi:hypothetical protein